ncbi:MAG: hypothetical protein A2516_08945 [Alphaproteobacteria bacterium RIFOXYD12_FULL_60_8]|nr:MAG: hypothetical protein A2516_08945 [Alphaproteobacteria bacterium RIFOXYD12_FULL_60_8]
MYKELFERERGRFLSKLDQGCDVLAHCPVPAYRWMMVEVVERLRKRGYKVICVSSDPVIDEFSELENSFFFHHGSLVEIFSQRPKPPLYITPTLLPGGIGERSLVFLHDIWDSPLGDENKFRNDARDFEYIAIPSKPALPLYERVLRYNPQEWRRVPQQTLIPCGYPKLDSTLARIAAQPPTPKTAIVYAPTVGFMSNVKEYGHKILLALATRFRDREIIFRPHPHDHNSQDMLYLIHFASRFQNITVDLESGDNYSSYARSSVLVSDLSGTAYTFAFTQLRPVVFFQPKVGSQFENMKDFAYVKNVPVIGALAETIEDIISRIVELEAEGSQRVERIKNLRDTSVFNVGHSLDYFIDQVDNLMTGKLIDGGVRID